eukprot:scaffold58992_cov32-Tisochrysis_lutea.AAC.1
MCVTSKSLKGSHGGLGWPRSIAAIYFIASILAWAERTCLPHAAHKSRVKKGMSDALASWRGRSIHCRYRHGIHRRYRHHCQSADCHLAIRHQQACKNGLCIMHAIMLTCHACHYLQLLAHTGTT